MVDQPVDGGHGHGLVREDFVSGAERLTGGDGEAFVFVASGDQFEENGAFGAIFLGICDVVQNDEIELVELREGSFQNEVFSGDVKFLHQIGCPRVENPVPGFDERMADGAEDVRLAGTGVANGNQIGPGIEPVAGGERLGPGLWPTRFTHFQRSHIRVGLT